MTNAVLSHVQQGKDFLSHEGIELLGKSSQPDIQEAVEADRQVLNKLAEAMNSRNVFARRIAMIVLSNLKTK